MRDSDLKRYNQMLGTLKMLAAYDIPGSGRRIVLADGKSTPDGLVLSADDVQAIHAAIAAAEGAEP